MYVLYSTLGFKPKPSHYNVLQILSNAYKPIDIYPHYIPTVKKTYEKKEILLENNLPETIETDFFNQPNSYLDTYLDSSYNEKGYSVPWVGIIHHPDNIPKEYSEANLSRIFKSNFWKLSKPHCKKLIILSNYVREQATKYVDSSLLVTLYHPMNQCLDKWDYDKWKLDGEKIYSIGNWLRNEFAIYQLNYKNKYKSIFTPTICVLILTIVPCLSIFLISDFNLE